MRFCKVSGSYYYSHWSEGSSLLCCSYNPSCIHPQVLCKLNLAYNGLTGGLEPLRYAKGSSPGLTHATTHAVEPCLCLDRDCTAVEELDISDNHITGNLSALVGFQVMRGLSLSNNLLSGGLEPLQGCKALLGLQCSHNCLTGGLEPLRGIAMRELSLADNHLTGGLEPLLSCTALQFVFLLANELSATDDATAHLEKQCRLFRV